MKEHGEIMWLSVEDQKLYAVKIVTKTDIVPQNDSSCHEAINKTNSDIGIFFPIEHVYLFVFLHKFQL